MKIKQLSALLLAVSMAAFPYVRAETLIEEDVVVETTEKGFNQPQCDASGKPIKSVAKKQRTDKTKDIKAKKGSSNKKVKKTKGKKTTKAVGGVKTKKAKKDDTISKLGKFNRKGEIKSFTAATNNIIGFINENAAKATATQKTELFTVIARFNWITGRKNFNSPDHYRQTVKLLQVASEHPALFGSAKVKFINKWLVEKEAQQNSTTKKVTPIKKAKKSYAKKTK